METNEQIEQKKRKKEILGRNCSQVRLREVTSLEQVVRRERMASLKDLLRSDCLDPITARPDSSIRTPTEARRESDGYRRNNGAKANSHSLSWFFFLICAEMGLIQHGLWKWADFIWFECKCILFQTLNYCSDVGRILTRSCCLGP